MKNWFGACWILCLLTVLGSLPSSAVVVQKELAAKDTPILLNEFYKQIEKYRTTYGLGDLRYFGMYIYDGDVKRVLAEIEKVLPLIYDPTNDYLNIQEFDRINLDLVNSGYEAAFPPELVLLYQSQLGPAGPQKTPDVDDNRKQANYYVHTLEFQYIQNYQKKGQPLGHGMNFPRATLDGWVFLKCENPFKNCVVTTMSIKSAAISWQVTSSPKGGNSSGGG